MGYFYWILTHKREVGNADAVVVFRGSDGRVPKGYEVIRKKKVPVLIISPADKKAVENYDRNFGPLKNAEYVIEERGYTTFQNGLFTGKIIREKGYRSVILVTDAYHMPRSYFFLRIFLIGQDVGIQTVGLDDTVFSRPVHKWPLKFKKHVYNEMIEFWGSMMEFAINKSTGKLSGETLKENRLVAILKSVLLLKV